MLAQLCKERPLCAEGRRTCQDVQPKITSLKFALAQVAPFGKSDVLAGVGAHGQRIAVDDVLHQHLRCDTVQVVTFIELKIFSK